MRLGSISGGRFDLAPQAIREALDRFVAHGSDQLGRLMEVEITIEDPGPMDEVASLSPAEAYEWIRRKIAISTEDLGQIRSDRAVVVLGGDNSITRPGVHAVAAHAGLNRTGLLTLDAHHDLRDTSNGLTNGNPVRALLEDGLPGDNIVQIGIQPFANSSEYSTVATQAGIEVITAAEARSRGVDRAVSEALHELAARVDAIYVDLDVDVLDRAFAPACPGSRPGGLFPAEIQAAARVAGSHPSVRALDIVEVDPDADVADITVLSAASFLLSFASGLASRGLDR
jgi:formiminoglutamase